MGVLFNILTNSIGSLFWGALIAIAVTGLVWLVFQLLNRGRLPLAYIVLAILFILTWAQATMMVGAMKAKGYVDDIGDYATTIADNLTESASLSAESIENLIQSIEDEYPIAKIITDRIDTSQLKEHIEKGNSVGGYFTEGLLSTLNTYIWHRVWWMTGFVTVAAVAITLLGVEGKRGVTRQRRDRRVPALQREHHRRRH